MGDHRTICRGCISLLPEEPEQLLVGIGYPRDCYVCGIPECARVAYTPEVAEAAMARRAAIVQSQRCWACRFWGEERERRREPREGEMRECQRVVPGAEEPTSLVMLQGHDDLSMHTDGDFGCLLWEGKDEP